MINCFLFVRIFSKEEIEKIRKMTLWDIIVNSTDIGPYDIQKNVFFWNDGDPCPQPMQLNASDLETCNHFNGYDYFEVTKWHVYIFNSNINLLILSQRIRIFLNFNKANVYKCNYGFPLFKIIILFVLLPGQRICLHLCLRIFRICAYFVCRCRVRCC